MTALTSGCGLIAGVDFGATHLVNGDAGALQVNDGQSPETPPDDASDGDTIASSPAASCEALLAADPSTRNRDGIYTIDPDKSEAGAPLRVYCQMSIDGGGWTLVGRSGLGAALSFGWTSVAGRVDDFAAPYSLDVVSAGLMFREIMLADHDSGSSSIASRAYKLSVPVDFLQSYPNTTVPTNAVTTLLGDCSPPGGPTELRYSGTVSRMDSFFFRDISDNSQHIGLSASGFLLTYDDCARGALLNKASGLIFVR